MSKTETTEIIHAFNNQKYDVHVKTMFDRSEYANKWSRDKIMYTLQKAFENGNHGMHFISCEFESIIGCLLEEYLGPDHYIAYRTCKTHAMLILQPNYRKLGISPQRVLKPSFKINDKIHSCQEKDDYADFCYEEL